jgi:pyruvate dehydrogenase E2 component (dihydrolipoamide acetyltransferase)
VSLFALPDLGQGLVEAEIVAWHVAPGDHVVADQPLVAVETAKAVVEIPAPHAGHIARLCAQLGERVKVGGPLVEYEAGAHRDAGTVVGDVAGDAAPGDASVPSRPAAAPPPAAFRAAPAVRALARALGVDLASVAGSGPGGAILRADVEARAGGRPDEGAAMPLSGVRRAMAEAMARTRAEIVPATLVEDADVETWPADADVTARLISAVVAACAAEPALNAWFDGASMTRRIHGKVDLGIAIATRAGLFVPVLRDVGSCTAPQLRQALDRAKRAVAERRIALSDLAGATITLSNFGTLGGRYAALAIVPPQVAILGAGRARAAVVARADRPAIRRVLPLSLTFDHRVVSGGEAARFLAAAIASLERAPEKDQEASRP